MINTPFNREDADEVADDFEDLVDTEFTLDKINIYYVDNVVVAPFSQDERARFIKHYLETKDCDDAIAFYEGSDFDVLVIALHVKDDTSYMCVDIRSFTAQQGIVYAFP